MLNLPGGGRYNIIIPVFKSHTYYLFHERYEIIVIPSRTHIPIYVTRYDMCIGMIYIYILHPDLGVSASRLRRP